MLSILPAIIHALNMGLACGSVFTADASVTSGRSSQEPLEKTSVKNSTFPDGFEVKSILFNPFFELYYTEFDAFWRENLHRMQ